MFRIRWLTRTSLVLALLALTVCLLPSGAPRPAHAGRPPAPLQVPHVGPFLNIWAEARDDREPAIAYNTQHDEYLVVWHQVQDANTSYILARRVAADGTLLNEFLVAGGQNLLYRNPAVAYNPDRDEYLVVYVREYSSTDYDIYVRRLSWDTGTMLSHYDLDVSQYLQHEPAVVYTPQGDYVVAYTNYAATNRAGVTLRRVDGTTGVPGVSLTISSSGAEQYRTTPALAYDVQANKILVAYVYMYKDGVATWHWDVMSVLQEPDLSSVFFIEEMVHQSSDFVSSLAVACWPGQNYLVTWGSGLLLGTQSIQARRVAANGVPQGPATGFTLASCTGSTACGDTRVAFAPKFRGFMVTWTFVGPPTGNRDISGRLVPPGQHAPFGHALGLQTAATGQETADVACAPGASASVCLVAEAHCPVPGLCSSLDIAGRTLGPWLTHLPVTVKN